MFTAESHLEVKSFIRPGGCCILRQLQSMLQGHPAFLGIDRGRQNANPPRFKNRWIAASSSINAMLRPRRRSPLTVHNHYKRIMQNSQNFPRICLSRSKATLLLIGPAVPASPAGKNAILVSSTSLSALPVDCHRGRGYRKTSSAPPACRLRRETRRNRHRYIDEISKIGRKISTMALLATISRRDRRRSLPAIIPFGRKYSSEIYSDQC